jgi:uncharacterized protein (DUF305 family)
MAAYCRCGVMQGGLMKAFLMAGLMMATPALAQTMKPMAGMSMGASSPEADAYNAAMSTMMSAMQGHATGKPDWDFVNGMLPHHQGAVDMAQVELKFGKDPALRRLAEQIIAAQNKEMAFMRKWLAAHPAPPGP